jgi:hypothetical protein
MSVARLGSSAPASAKTGSEHFVVLNICTPQASVRTGDN